MSLQNAIARLTEIYENHTDHKTHEKIYDFIDKELPERIKLYLQREQRKEELEKKSEQYINDFLLTSMVSYFYIPASNIFIAYDGKTNSTINENVILHKILTSISNNKAITPWKYKTKNAIMKRIKEKNIFQLIPESYTIQYILTQLTPTLFKTKEEAKYFLTVLGDNILKKKTRRIHLVDPKSKEFMNSIQEHMYSYFKNSYHIDTTFKYKYYEHDYSQCRIITFNPAVSIPTYWNTFVKPYILDIVCVAVHYSIRYQCADNYLTHNALDVEIYNNIFYIKNHSEKQIVENFLKEFIVSVPKHSNLKMRWRELYYLWKTFLQEHHLPSIMFIKQLKLLINQQLEYCEKEDAYMHITSPVLSYVSNLQKFWVDTVTVGEHDEFEISELCNLYDKWLKKEGLKKDKTMNESIMIFILEHFYDITIENKKYIHNIKCALWDKQEDIKNVIKELKIMYKFSPELYDRSIQCIYPDYCSHAPKVLNHGNIVSKQYFSKYIHQVIPEKYIIENKIANAYWLT